MSDFVSTLMAMRGGEVALDCDRKFKDVLAAVLETGQAGEIVLKVKVKPSKFAMGGAVLEVETSHECKLKKPELSIGKSLFFVGQDGLLTRDDPAQLAMYKEEEIKRGN